MQYACMGSTGGSAIPSPPNTFQHAELPLNFTENNHFHHGASFSAHVSCTMVTLARMRRQRSRGPGRLSARAYGCEYMYQCHLHVKWENTERAESQSHTHAHLRKASSLQPIVLGRICVRVRHMGMLSHLLNSQPLTNTKKCKSVLFDAFSSFPGHVKNAATWHCLCVWVTDNTVC